MNTQPSLLLAAFALLALLSACRTVSIPLAANDKAPVVTINVYGLPGSSTAAYTSNATVGIPNGINLRFVVTAFSPGGVRDLYLTFLEQSNKLHLHADPDASGKVPEQLSLATDNNKAIAYVYSGQGTTFHVTAEGTNFNNQFTTVILQLAVPLNPPTIASFGFPKKSNGEDAGYVNLGQSAPLQWSINDCNGCTISIRGTYLAAGSTQQVSLNAAHLPVPSGSLWVTPVAQFTDYTLTAASPYGSVSKTFTQQIYVPVATGTALNTYYFKVSDGTYCWTQSTMAAKESDAQTLVKNANQNMSVTPITATQFGDPATCGN